jgi:predicted nucleic acid-binding protein
VNEENLFIRAGQLSSKKRFLNFGVGLIDCSILQVALEYDSSIWSKDKNLCKAAIELKIKLVG